MRKNKKTVHQANGKTVTTEERSSHILPHKASDVKRAILDQIRENHNGYEVVEKVQELYPRFDRPLESKVERDYGIELQNDAMNLLIHTFLPDLEEDIRRHRQGGHKLTKRISARLPDKMYSELHALIKRKGYSSMQAWLTAVVTWYLKEDKNDVA